VKVHTAQNHNFVSANHKSSVLTLCFATLQEVSSAIDKFSVSVYPPQQTDTVNDCCTKLGESVLRVIEIACSDDVFVSRTSHLRQHEEWLQTTRRKLQKAQQRVTNKITPM
jgi:hypothetical protein